MVEERVLALYHFINKHRHICNAHSVDFFVCNHWENAVSEVWGTLDKMPPDDLFLNPLASNTTDIPQSLHEFFLEARSLRLEGLAASDDAGSPDHHHHSPDNLSANSSEVDHHGGTMGSLPLTRHQCSDSSSEGRSVISSELSEMVPCDGLVKLEMDVSKTGECKLEALASFGMNKKKAHEVRSFSEFVAKEIANTGITQLLDLGSGKGYVSQHLALCYDLTVVGVDAQLGNTAAANKRNKKVHKMWRKSASKDHSQTEPPSPLPPASQVCSDSRHALLEDELCLDHLFTPQSSASRAQGDDETGVLHSSNITEGYVLLEGSGSDHLRDGESPTVCQALHLSSTVPPARTDASAGKVWSQSHFNNEGLTVRKNVPSISTEKTCLKHKQIVSGSSFCPVTMELTAGNSPALLKAAEEESGGVFHSWQPFAVVGLHTCGDLASTAFRLFAAVPTARSVCIVGCCYHHITEPTGEGSSGPAGFPMSRRLQEVEARLGRKTRMLACQTITKFRETTTGVSLQTIFWRAALQVVFARKFKEVYERRSSKLITGRLKKAVPKDFIAYARSLIPKVGLSNSEVSDEELLEIEEEFLSSKPQLEFYLKLRAVLAPCIESLIVLDRLLFLQELDGVESAEVKGIFDPAVSPRCLALVAHKHS